MLATALNIPISTLQSNDDSEYNELRSFQILNAIIQILRAFTFIELFSQHFLKYTPAEK